MPLYLTKAQKETLDITEVCAVCELATSLRDDTVLCQKHGVVGAGGHCKHFRYDLLKRKPVRKTDLPHITEPLPSLDD